MSGSASSRPMGTQLQPLLGCKPDLIISRPLSQGTIPEIGRVGPVAMSVQDGQAALLQLLLDAGVPEHHATETLGILRREHVDSVDLLLANLGGLNGTIPLATFNTIKAFLANHSARKIKAGRDSPALPQQPDHAVLLSTGEQPLPRSPAKPTAQELQMAQRTQTEWWLKAEEEDDRDLSTDAPPSLRAKPAPASLVGAEPVRPSDSLSFGLPDVRSTPSALDVLNGTGELPPFGVGGARQALGSELSFNSSRRHLAARPPTQLELPPGHAAEVAPTAAPAPGRATVDVALTDLAAQKLRRWQNSSLEHQASLVTEPMEMGLVWLAQILFTVSTITLAVMWAWSDADEKPAFVMTMFVCGIAGSAYYAKVTGYGELRLSGSDSTVPIARYIDWRGSMLKARVGSLPGTVGVVAVRLAPSRPSGPFQPPGSSPRR